MTVNKLHLALSDLFPPALSASWDNDGVMCAADPDAPVRRAVIALDGTVGAIGFAAKTGSVLITHHPMIFRGVRSVVGGDVVPDRILSALSAGVPVISFHTRLDAADGGVNDALVAALGLPVADAVKFGDEECPSVGRLVTLGAPLSADALAARVRDALGSPAVRVTGDGTVAKLAVVGGAGGDFLAAARSLGADALLTGEVGYNKAEDAAEGGLAVIEAGHYHTEAPVLAPLAEAVRALGIETEIFDTYPQRFI